MESKSKYSKSETNNNNVALRILNNHNLRSKSITTRDYKYAKGTKPISENLIKADRSIRMSTESDESDDIPCKKRRLQNTIKKVVENECYKRKLDNVTSNDIISPLKRLKIQTATRKSTESTSNTVPNIAVKCISASSNANDKSDNSSKFIEACQEISSNEFYDIKSRVGISVLPDCCNDQKQCQKNHGKSKVDLYQVISHEQEAFKINFNAKMWNEALNVCKNILRPNKYPSVDMLLCIVEIILTSHEDSIQKQPLQLVLHRCMSTFKLYFSTHPPCSKVIRKLYISFLTNSFVKHNEEIKYSKNGGVFEYIMDELENILDNYSNESSEDKPKMDCDITVTLNAAHVLKSEQETYESLSMSDKIKRLFLVLEIIVDLLERDLAIWISMHNHNSNKIMFGPHKPLMAHVLWNQNPFYTGTVNTLCKQIFTLFVRLIKLEFPTSNLRIFTRLMNTLSNTYYLCEGTTECIYPNIGKHVTTFTTEMYNIIKDESIQIKMKVASHIETKYLRYFMTSTILKTFTKSKEENFMNLVFTIFQQRTWASFPDSPETINTNFFKRKFIPKNSSTTETKRVFARILSKLKSNKLKDDKLNKSFMEYIPNNNCLSMQTFLLVLYVSFKSYLDLYNIENIQIHYNNVNNVKKPKILHDILVKNDNDKSEKQFISDYNSQILLISDNSESYPCITLSEDCLKEYRSIFRILKKIVILYSDLKSESQIHNLFKYIQILQ